IAYIHNKDITIDDLLHFVKAPDFPTGGIIYGMEGVKQGLLTGRGRVVLRGKCHVETKQSGREQIIITEVPYQVGLDALTDKIGQLVNDKTIEGIAHVNNESNKREGIRIVIDLKRDAVANIIINQLYKFTELQTSFGINNVAISKGRPRIFNVKDLIVEFVDFRMDVVIRRSKFELKKAEDRAHLLEGYLKVINDKDHLDLAISIIRGSATPDEAKKSLIERSIADNWYLPDNLFDEKAKIHYLQGIGLSEKQAQAILELRLQRLTGLEREKIIEEFNDLMNTIVRLKDLLASEDLRYDLIKTELEEVKAKFGEPRKSEIQFLADEVNMLDFIKEEDVVITVSHLGYIKRTSATEYRQQKRGGRGAIGSKTREEDFVEHLFVASTHDVMMFFTEKGRCYWLNVYEIPEGEKQSKGRAIQNLIQIPPDDKIKAIIDVKDLDKKETLQNRYVVLCTKKGIIKKTDLEDFSRPRTTGINAITILEGDELLEAKLTDGNCEIMMAVKSGRAIRFNEEKVRATGRGAIGVTGIEVDETNDEVVGMICVNKNDTDKTVLVISEKGYGKRTKLTDEDGEDVYRITNRGGKGVKTINVTEKTGRLVGILDVNEKEDLIITCQSGITLRTSISTIKTAGRNTQGVILIRLDAEDAIAAISKIEETEEETTTEVNDQSENNSPENTDNLNTNIENSN
ncbi:MAG TPA: DNA gyrase C-terminal beta-propeller domain-containing protein, partial [Chitinophagaceae bacterium]|nr:DNA gyrase C-terminal beta-propeller domain-containing protein [Chitinophagaceae bacterium]